MGRDSDRQPANEVCVDTETKEPEFLRGHTDVDLQGVRLPAVSVVGRAKRLTA